MTTTTTTKDVPTLLKRLTLDVAGWFILIKIRKKYGKRVFWLTYLAASCFSASAHWEENAKQWAQIKEQIKELQAERQKRQARQQKIDDLATRLGMDV